jgi:exopolysaccharide biosynthesis polyprenyl glycosylphosphotransferase
VLQFSIATMKNNSSLIYSFSLVVGDFLALVAAFAGAYILRVSISHKPISESVSATTYVEIFLLVLPFWILIFALMGLYNSTIYEKRFVEAGKLLVGSFLGLLFVTGAAYFSNKPLFPAKLVPIYGFVFAFLFLIIFRNIARSIRGIMFSYDIGITNILLVGNTPMSEELINVLQDRRTSGYKIMGVVTQKEHAATRYPRLSIFKTFEEAIGKLRVKNIHSIVQTELYADSNKNNDLLDFAQQHHIAFRFIPGNSEMFVGNLEVELFKQSLPVVTVHQTALVGWGRIVKRVFDLTLGSLLLILASPLLFIISVLQLLSGGHVFFRQTRLTRFDQKFRVFKFRTVRPGYNGLSPEEAFEKMNKPHLIKRYRENGDYLPNDPRYGRFGNFLRKTSLDELPQLFNVLKGDLSLVGPRALVPEELSLFEKRHAILSVKSGMTGLAQVSGRRHINFDERRKLDMYYVQHWSFWMDLVILTKTVRVLFRGEGAR